MATPTPSKHSDSVLRAVASSRKDGEQQGERRKDSYFLKSKDVRKGSAILQRKDSREKSHLTEEFVHVTAFAVNMKQVWEALLITEAHVADHDPQYGGAGIIRETAASRGSKRSNEPLSFECL